MVYEYKGKKRFVNFGGMVGASDLMGSYQGRFWCCEVKTVEEHAYIKKHLVRLRSGIINNKAKDIRYKNQIDFIDKMNAEGHIAFFCSDVVDFMDTLSRAVLIGTKLDRPERLG